MYVWIFFYTWLEFLASKVSVDNNLIYKVESGCVCLCVCLCVRYRNPHCWTNPHQIWHGRLNLQGPGHRLCFGPRGGPRGQGGPKQGLESIYSCNHETRKKIYKTKVVGKVCFSGGGSYFWARNPDPEGPGPMCFWSHGQLFSGKFYYTNYII
jgi:hypothetical protein